MSAAENAPPASSVAAADPTIGSEPFVSVFSVAEPATLKFARVTGDGDGVGVGVAVAAGVAVVVLSARDATAEKVAALDLGASDYVTKPFDPEEILARVRTALRHRARLAGGPGGQAVLRFADVEIDLAARQVRKGGAEVHLAPKEYAFLAELAGSPGRVVTHAQLLRTIWGPGHETDVEYLRVAARGIRRKLESDRPPGQSALRNEPGIGYRLDLTRG